MSARSDPLDMFALIHPVRKASQSWLSVIGRLVSGSSGFGIGTLV